VARVELTAPAGDRAMLNAAVQAGADAVYLGVRGFNMRATARNFAGEELSEITEFSHRNGVKVYLTLNTLIYEQELPALEKILLQAKKAKIDAVIAFDLAVIQGAAKLGLKVHISTQAGVSNSETARFYQQLGASRCVLARECSLEQIRTIGKNTDVEIEVFAHGAMCVSLSGRCFLSQFLYGRSANRGDCIQPCRRAYDTYLLRDRQEGGELVMGNDYVLSARDLCTLPFLEQLLPYVHSLKIEGRARSPEYVAAAVRVYRETLTAIERGLNTRDFKEKQLEKLKGVYHRGFSSGFYLGKPIDEFTKVPGSQGKMKKLSLGSIKNFYSKIGVAEIAVTANELKLGDEILIIGPKTGVVSEKVASLEVEHQRVESAAKGERVGVKLSSRVRRNDQVFLRQEIERGGD